MSDEDRPPASRPPAGPPVTSGPTLSAGAPEPGVRIGVYRVLQKLSEGGMGEVYEAEQEQPIRRRVAIKLIKAGMDSRQVIARFESERQALALMNHPCIARILDAGVTEAGRPYFAMEYVKGVPITEYCDKHCLPIRERLALFVQVCDAVQHAHQKGVIHRDLKPANVLVAVEDAGPAPKIIDFGVAKAIARPLTEHTLFTELGQVIGTPDYMSPEQAEMSGLDVDTRTDVYSLGVILYELLTGVLPLETRESLKSGYDQFRRRILEDEPPTPSTRWSSLDARPAAERHGAETQVLARQLRGDLDWITMKALEKDRMRRYGSAAELGADIARHLAHQPVLASPPSSLYRFGKFVHRHRTGTALVVTLVVAVIGYAVTMGVQARRIARERDRANAKAELARQERQSAEEVVDFLVKLFKVSNPGGAPDSTITARAVLDRGAEEIRRGLARQPVVRARLMNTMARVYFNLGIEGQARTLVEAALAARPDDPQHPDPVVAKSLTILGHLEVSQGRFSEARRLYERALAIWNATDAPDPLEAARVIENLATLRAMDGDMVQADSLHRRSLGILEQALGPNDPDVANVLHNIGVLRMSMGDNASAEQSFLRALAIEERALGPRSPLLASTLDNLGQLSMSTGDDDHARRYFTRALAIRESLFGDNLETSWSVSGLALLEAREGHRAEAERLHRRAQRIFTAEKHADTPEVLYFEASFAAVSGDRAEALHELQRALAEPGLSGLLLHDTNFASLQGDPTFEAMLSAARRGTAKQ